MAISVVIEGLNSIPWDEFLPLAVSGDGEPRDYGLILGLTALAYAGYRVRRIVRPR